MTFISEEGDRSLSPVEAFHLLGNDTRIGILQALWDAFESTSDDNDLTYSELFERVDIRDSGNFSYHLEKLTGPYVRRTDTGYALKQTGINVVRAVRAGTVTHDPEFGPTRVDLGCPFCEAPIEVAYRDETMTAVCSACEGTMRWKGEPGLLFAGLAPPAAIEGRTAEEAFLAAFKFTLHQIAAFFNGICPHCSSAVEPSVNVCPDHDVVPGTLCARCHRGHLAEVVWSCPTCKRGMYPPLKAVVVDQPVVTSFYHDHGIEHRLATWEGRVRSYHIEEEVIAEDPLQIKLTVRAGEEALQLVVDEDLTVTERD